MATLEELQKGLDERSINPNKLTRKQRRIIDELIDRGDLSKDISIEYVPIAQRKILLHAKKLNKNINCAAKVKIAAKLTKVFKSIKDSILPVSKFVKE